MHMNQEIQNKIDMDLKIVHGLLHTIYVIMCIWYMQYCICGVIRM